MYRIARHHHRRTSAAAAASSSGWTQHAALACVGLLLPGIICGIDQWLRSKFSGVVATAVTAGLLVAIMVMYTCSIVLRRMMEIDLWMYGTACTHQKCAYGSKNGNVANGSCPQGCTDGLILSHPPPPWNFLQLLLLWLAVPDSLMFRLRR